MSIIQTFASQAVSGNRYALYSTDGGQNLSTVSQALDILKSSMSNNGTRVVGASGNGLGLWYSINGGVTWIQSNITTDNYNDIKISYDGTRAIAAFNGLYYSADSGVTWTPSNIQTGQFTAVSMASNGMKAIAASSTGIYYTDNGGVTWLQSNITTYFRYISISYDGTKAVTGSATNAGLWYSTDGGVTWFQSNITTGYLYDISLSQDGMKAVAVNSTSGGSIYYTTNGGATWAISNLTNLANNFYDVSISEDGTKAVAGSETSAGLWYSINGGETWTQSNVTTGAFNNISIARNGLNVVAGATPSSAVTGLWYSTDGGETWLQSNITTGYIETTSISYVSSPSPSPLPVSNICFPAGTLINTDQGRIAIEKINPNINTINNKRIVDIIKTIYNDDYLVGFKKNSISINYPSEFTVMTKNHKISWQGVMFEAHTFLYRYDNVVKVKYNREILYNVLMEEHSNIIVNNMICETLDPNNVVAKLYNRFSKYTKNDRYKISNFITDSIKKTKYNQYKKYKNIIKKI